MKITTNRSQPLSGMVVNPEFSVLLSPAEVDRIFWKRLSDLIENTYIDEKGKLQEYGGTHPHNGDEMYRVVGLAEDLKDDPRWKIAIAAIHLRKAIMDVAV
jgi:hypothetical protein